MIGGDASGDGLDDGRLTGLWRSDDEAAAALADRGDEVDDTRGNVFRRDLHLDPLIGEKRGQLIEIAANRHLGRLSAEAVDALDTEHALVLLAFFRRTNESEDHVTLAQTEALGLGLRDVDVARRRDVIVPAQESPAVVDDLENALGIECAIGPIDVLEKALDDFGAWCIHRDLRRLAGFGQFGRRHTVVVIEIEFRKTFQVGSIGLRESALASGLVASAATAAFGFARSKLMGHRYPVLGMNSNSVTCMGRGREFA